MGANVTLAPSPGEVTPINAVLHCNCDCAPRLHWSPPRSDRPTDTSGWLFLQAVV